MEYAKLEIQIDNALKEISALDISTESAYETILEIIDKRIPIRPIPQLVIRPGKIFYRSRCHMVGELEFSDLLQLTYRKDISNIKNYGRANKPKQSVFYCADSWDAAIFEAGQISRVKDCSSILEEIHSVTRWISKKELKFLVFLDSENSIDNNALSNSHIVSLSQILDEKYDSRVSNIANKIIRFISKEFSKDTFNDSNKYKISCAFSEKWTKEGIDGVIYPSFQRCFERLNYAIRPESVDDCLDLIDASIEYIEKEEGSIYKKTYSKPLISNIQGKLLWGEKIFSRKPFGHI